MDTASREELVKSFIPGRSLLRILRSRFLFQAGVLRNRLNRLNPSWKILMYHRVVDPKSLSYPLEPGMYVTPKHFRAQMQFLAKHCNVISLEDLTIKLQRQTPIEAPTVCVTFDDGWRDNYDNAFPSLKEFNIPATIFLATSFIGSRKRFWSDKLAFLLYETWKRKQQGQLPPDSQLNDEQRNIVSALALARNEKWFANMLNLITVSLKSPNEEIRERFFRGLAELGASESSVPDERVFLSWDEVREMSTKGISFGNHTSSHLPLGSQSIETARREIQLASTAFKENGITQSPIFCYPEGSFTDDTHTVITEEGFKAILTTSQDSNLDDGLLKLGRTGVHDDISQDTANFLYRLVS